MANFEKAQQIVGLSEGGYQADPKDDGNYYMGQLIGTNWGISAPTLAGYLGRTPSVTEMLDLSKQLAQNILKAGYWTKNSLGSLANQSVANLIYDGVVNQGTSAMRYLMEKVLKELNNPLRYYEVFTTRGIKLLNKLNQKRLFDTIKKARQNKYLQSSQKQYIQGWLKRLDRIQYYSNNSLSAIWPYAALLIIGIGILIISLP